MIKALQKIYMVEVDHKQLYLNGIKIKVVEWCNDFR